MASQTPKRNPRYRRPDTYQAAADVVGVSAPYLYQVVHGIRQTTLTRRKAILAWARDNARKGRAEAPAVAAALLNLKTAA